MLQPLCNTAPTPEILLEPFMISLQFNPGKARRQLSSGNGQPVTSLHSGFSFHFGIFISAPSEQIWIGRALGAERLLLYQGDGLNMI